VELNTQQELHLKIADEMETQQDRTMLSQRQSSLLQILQCSRLS